MHTIHSGQKLVQLRTKGDEALQTRANPNPKNFDLRGLWVDSSLGTSFLSGAGPALFFQRRHSRESPE